MDMDSAKPSPENILRWIELKEEKAFSRLLYPNPVCFLSTFGESPDTDAPSIDSRKTIQRNVMVLSWLTATNNSGRFMFSLNRRRHTASVLVPGVEGPDSSPRAGVEFVLSVPVKGMEQLVRDVGRTSGRWGSKFSEDHSREKHPDAPIVASEAETAARPTTKRQKKRELLFAMGVPGLRPVPLGNSSHSESATLKTAACAGAEGNDEEALSSATACHFGIEGTVAHMKCRTYSISPQVIDDDHYLVMAEVISAFVHPSYWDTDRMQFRPLLAEECPPYLTFFGSQMFGYVVSDAS